MSKYWNHVEYILWPPCNYIRNQQKYNTQENSRYLKLNHIFLKGCVLLKKSRVRLENDFLKDFIYLFLEREEGREKEGGETLMWERYMDQLPLPCPQLRTWPTTQAWALTGNRIGYLSVCRLVLNPLSCTSQGKVRKYLRWNDNENHISSCGVLLKQFLEENL